MPAHHTARVGFLMLGDSVSHISLRHLYYMESERDEDFIAHVTSISTSLSIRQCDLEDLFRAAKVLMRELEERNLLPKQNLRIRCGPAVLVVLQSFFFESLKDMTNPEGNRPAALAVLGGVFDHLVAS